MVCPLILEEPSSEVREALLYLEALDAMLVPKLFDQSVRDHYHTWLLKLR